VSDYESLQNTYLSMLSQQLQTQTPQQPNQQQFQQPQALQPSIPNLSAIQGPNGSQLRDFVKNHPEAIAQIQRRHPDNQQALLNELTQMAHSQNLSLVNASQQQQMQQPSQSLRQPSFNLDASQLPINYLHTQQQQQQQQQPIQRINSPSQKQRLPSSDQFQNFQAMQNQMNGMGSIDPKQMEAVRFREISPRCR
jgi:putative protein kinase ArgK-like GTPase of G3E family